MDKQLGMMIFYILFLCSLVCANTVTYNFTIGEKWMAPDGYWRPVTTINGQSPGPVIKAKQGDTIIVNVFNNLANKDITLHFHGIEQRGTPSMDGVPYVTQYPIRYNEHYQYKFNVKDQYGTYWYHAHTSGTYVDGLRGPIIIEPKKEYLHYDQDETLMVYDWYHETSNMLSTILKSTGVFPTCIQSILFNGKGQSMPSNCSDITMTMMSDNFINGYNEMSFNPPTTTQSTNTSLYSVEVESNKVIMLRFINAAAVSDFEISIDNHSMKVVEADGIYLSNPQTVEKLRISIGQRYSVLIHTNQQQNAWIRASRYPTDDMMKQSIEGRAILKYQNSNAYPTTVPASSGVMLDDSKLTPIDNKPPKKSNKTFKFNVLNYKENIWTIDGTPYTDPDIPFICKHQKTKVAFDIQYGDIVDIVLNISTKATDTMGHPFHIHGHKFWVLGFGEGQYETSKLNLINPPYRDSMYMPQNGWLAIRFKADNPGIWIFHCHIEWHSDTGMVIVFNEAFDRIDKPDFCSDRN
jgi:L-ascorbate oxidase